MEMYWEWFRERFHAQMLQIRIFQIHLDHSVNMLEGDVAECFTEGRKERKEGSLP